MGWVEERWAARGWGGGEGEGIMEPTEAAARKGARRENEKAALPSFLLRFRFSHLVTRAVGSGISTTSACVFGFLGLERGVGRSDSLFEHIAERVYMVSSNRVLFLLRCGGRDRKICFLGLSGSAGLKLCRTEL